MDEASAVKRISLNEVPHSIKKINEQILQAKIALYKHELEPDPAFDRHTFEQQLKNLETEKEKMEKQWAKELEMLHFTQREKRNLARLHKFYEKAVKNNEVHKIFLKIWNNTNIENVLINAYYVGSVLYPEKFSDIDFAKKADEIYELFLGRPIYDEMVERFGEPGKINLK